MKQRLSFHKNVFLSVLAFSGSLAHHSFSAALDNTCPCMQLWHLPWGACLPQTQHILLKVLQANIPWGVGGYGPGGHHSGVGCLPPKRAALLLPCLQPQPPQRRASPRASWGADPAPLPSAWSSWRGTAGRPECLGLWRRCQAADMGCGTLSEYQSRSCQVCQLEFLCLTDLVIKGLPSAQPARTPTCCSLLDSGMQHTGCDFPD